MKKNAFKEQEVFSSVRVPHGPCIIRLDGWKFHSLSEALQLKRPFDRIFAQAMAATAQRLMEQFDASAAFVFSDEISLLFLKKPGFERVEKIDSVFAGLASSTLAARLCFRKKIFPQVAFDCRAIPLARKDLAGYLAWRQAEARRNYLNSIAYWSLRKKGLNAREAAEKLEGLKTGSLAALAGTPVGKGLWQQRGAFLSWKKFKKKGFDPLRKKSVEVERRRVDCSWKPPLFSSAKGKRFIESSLKASQ